MGFAFPVLVRGKPMRCVASRKLLRGRFIPPRQNLAKDLSQASSRAFRGWSSGFRTDDFWPSGCKTVGGQRRDPRGTITTKVPSHLKRPLVSKHGLPRPQGASCCDLDYPTNPRRDRFGYLARPSDHLVGAQGARTETDRCEHSRFLVSSGFFRPRRWLASFPGMGRGPPFSEGGTVLDDDP